jgi:hypothetical protein
VSFQRLKTWKTSRDADYEPKKNRILHLYGLMDGTVDVLDGDPDVVICVDEFGPLNLQPHPGRQWALAGGGGSTPRRRRRATYKRPHGVGHLLAAYDLSRDKLYGHIKPRKRRGEFLVFLRYVGSLSPRRYRSRSCWTTTRRTCRPGLTGGWGAGLRPTTSSLPIHQPTPVI